MRPLFGLLFAAAMLCFAPERAEAQFFGRGFNLNIGVGRGFGVGLGVGFGGGFGGAGFNRGFFPGRGAFPVFNRPILNRPFFPGAGIYGGFSQRALFPRVLAAPIYQQPIYQQQIFQQPILQQVPVYQQQMFLRAPVGSCGVSALAAPGFAYDPCAPGGVQTFAPRGLYGY